MTESWLNVSLIRDPGLSYAAVSGLRVVATALLLLMLLRLAQVILTARSTHPPFTLLDLLEYGGVERWRKPITCIFIGVGTMAISFVIQVFTGQGSPSSPLANLTPWLLFTYSALMLMSLGFAMAFGLVKEIILVWARMHRAPGAGVQ